MPVVRPSLALIACLAWTPASAAVALPTVGPQDAPAVLDAQQRTIARFEAYLDHNPFHEGGFERLVESAVAVNGLDDLMERYSTRIEEGDAQRSTRIVLARLYSRTERAGEAIEILTTIAEEDAAGEAAVDAQLAHLLGRLALDQRLLKDAVRAFNTAAAATTDVRLLERIHADRGAAHLAIGDTQAAVSAFRDLTLLDPQSFHLRLAAAEAMSTNGLFEEALAEYSTAIELAAEMIPRLCRALSESGRLQERLDRPTDALATYDRALDLLGRGHWLKRDLLTRVLALHQRAGSLTNLIRDLRTRVEADKADLDRRELLARALEETREVADARRVLEEAVDDFPDDLPLGRRLLDLLSRAGDVDARIAEYQRQIERHPTELDLYLQLGQTFASEGRLEQARRQWDRTLESRLSDPGLCVRLAGLYALYDMHEQAVRMLERAIDLEPSDLGHFGELASVLVRSNQKQELPALLERARLAAGQNSGRLEVLADLARGLRHTGVARSALEAAIAVNPGDPRLLRSLADVCVEEGDFEGAADTLQRILIVAGDDANARRDAAKRLVRLYQRRGLLRELGRKQEVLLEADATAPGAHYVLSRVAAVQHKRTVAVKHLQALLEINPDDVVAATDYAKLQLELGDDAAAIAQYEDLIRVRPALHATYLKEIAAIHVNQRREGKALDCYDEILKLSPGNPATFAEVAGRFRALDEHERAAECLRQAVRLRPDDGRYRMELAAVYTELEDAERAQREVLLALRSKEEVVRGRARAWLHERLVEQGAVDEEIARQRERLKVNPYDTEITLTLVDLFVRELEYELALDLIGDLLAYRPDSTPLLLQRAGLQEEMKRWDRARDDYETLLRLPDVDREELQYSIARCALELGDKARADAVLLGAADPLRVAGLYTRFNLHGQATATIEKALTLVPDDRLLLDRLVRMFEGRGDLDAALEAHARRIDLDGEDWELMQRRSELLVAANRSDELVATTSRMIDTLEVPTEPEGASRFARRRLLRTARSTYRKKLNELRRFYIENGLNAEFAELARARLLAAPADEDLFKLALSAIQWSSMDQGMYQGMYVISGGMVAGIPQADGDDGGGPLALETLLAVRRATVDAERLPPGHDSRSWNMYLNRAEQSLYRRHPVLAAQRTTELDQVGAASLTRVQIDERIDLLAKQGRSKDLVQALKEAVASHPERVEYLAGLAFQLYESRDPLAPTLLAELVEKLEANTFGLRGRRDDDPGAHERHTRRILKKLPDALREQTDDELTVSLYRLGCNSPLKDGWRVGRTPDALTARLIWGRSLADQGREAEAREVLSVLHPASPEFVSWTSTLAENYQSLGWNAEAARLEQSLFDVVQHVMQHPVLAHKRRWPATVRAVMVRTAHRLEREEHLLEAHELLRCWAGHTEASTLVSLHDAAESLIAHYTQALAEARAAKDSLGSRRYGVLLGELLTDAEEWDLASDVYNDLLRADPSDDSLVTGLAVTRARAGDSDEAIAIHRSAMQRKLERFEKTGELPPAAAPMNFFSEDGPLTDPGHLEPAAIPAGSSSDRELFSELSQSRMFGFNPTTKTPDLSGHWIEIFRIAFLDKDYKVAGEAFEAIHSTNSNMASYVQYELRQALDARRLTGQAVDLWRVLYDIDTNDSSVVLGYGQSLVALGRKPEAERVYRKFLRGKAAQNQYRNGRIERELRIIAPEAVTKAAEAEPLDPAEAVAADPKNVRLRLVLVKHFLEQRRYTEACEVALETERLAPHLEEVRELARDTLVLVGRDAEYEERLLKTLQSSNDPRKRLVTAVRLADSAWERGDHDAIHDLFALASRGGQLVNADLSLAKWWIGKGRNAEARAALEEDYRRTVAQNWRAQQLQASIAQLTSSEEDPTARVDAMWTAALESNGRIITSDILEALRVPINGLLGRDGAREAIEAAAAEHGGVRGGLYLAALDLALGRVSEAEERLMQLGLDDASAKMLMLNAVQSARDRGEWGRARTYLERLDEAYPANDQRRVETPIGELGERQTLLVELGSLAALEGDAERARELWDEAFRRERDGSRRWAHMFARHEMFAEAGEALRQHMESSGGRDVDDLLLMASIDRALGRTDEVIQGLQLARALETAQSETGERRLEGFNRAQEDAYRAAGRLEELRAQARGDLQRDADDGRSAALLVNLTLELDGPLAVQELAQSGEIDESLLSGVYGWMAQRALDVGDLEQATKWCELELNSGRGQWGAQAAAQALAGIKRQLGGEGEAARALRRAHGDPDSSSTWWATAREFANDGNWDLALACLDSGLEAGGNARNEPWDLRARLLLETGQAEQAGQVFFEGIERSGLRLAQISDATVRRLARETDLDEQTRELLGQAPDDPVLLLRAALFARAREDHEVAVSHLEALHALRPDQEVAEALLWHALADAGEHARAISILEATIERLDREQVLLDDGNSRPSRKITTLREERAELALRGAGSAAAIDAWTDQLGRRFEPIDPDTYSLNYLSFDPGQEDLARDLWTYGLFEELVAHTDHGSGLGPGGSLTEQRGLEAMFRSGRRVAALERLWELSLAATLDDAQGSDRMYYSSFSASGFMLTSSGFAQLDTRRGTGDELELYVRLSVEDGRAQELQRRLEERLESGGQASVRSALALLHRIMGRPAETMALIEPSEEDDPPAAREWASYAQAAYRAGAADVAHAALVRQGAVNQPLLQLSQYWESLPYIESPGEPVRFQFGMSGDMGFYFSSGSSYFSSSGDFGMNAAFQSPVDPDLWIAVLYARGQKREARTAEQAELLRRMNHGSEQPEADLARALAALDRFDEAQRLAKQHIRSLPEEPAPDLCAALLSAAHRLGRESDRDYWIEQYLATRALEDNPDTPERRWQLAFFLAQRGGSEEQIRVEVQRAAELDPQGYAAPQNGNRGWIALATGDVAAAESHFSAALEERRLAGQRESSAARTLRFGLGFALAASEDPSTARPVLLRALAESPDDRFAQRARALLGL